LQTASLKAINSFWGAQCSASAATALGQKNSTVNFLLSLQALRIQYPQEITTLKGVFKCTVQKSPSLTKMGELWGKVFAIAGHGGL
jgi:hypothetical protein